MSGLSTLAMKPSEVSIVTMHQNSGCCFLHLDLMDIHFPQREIIITSFLKQWMTERKKCGIGIITRAMAMKKFLLFWKNSVFLSKVTVIVELKV